MIVFFRTQDHLIQDDGQLEPAWGATKTWPAMFMLVVAAISESPLSSRDSPSGFTGDLRQVLTCSGVTFVYAFRQMGQQIRYHGRRFHDWGFGRVSPYLGYLSGAIP